MISRVYPAVIAVFSVLLPSTILAQAVTGTLPPPAEHAESAAQHPEAAARPELSPRLEGPPRVKRDIEREEPQTALVLCYHIVESPQDPRMEISRETFVQQMRYLAATGYNVIPLRDLYDYVAGRKASLPKNAIVITIDDGWRSTYTEVYPEMKRHHFPFTVFIYPRIIGQTSHAEPLALASVPHPPPAFVARRQGLLRLAGKGARQQQAHPRTGDRQVRRVPRLSLRRLRQHRREDRRQGWLQRRSDLRLRPRAPR